MRASLATRTADELQEGCEMNVYEPCLFSKFAKEGELGFHGNTSVQDSLVGGALLEVDDHLMRGPGLAHHLSKERLRGKINFGKWHRLMQDGTSFFGGRHVTQETGWGILECRPDEAGTACTSQGSVSRAVKDLSDANRPENRLKQTEEVEIHIHFTPPPPPLGSNRLRCPFLFGDFLVVSRLLTSMKDGSAGTSAAKRRRQRRLRSWWRHECQSVRMALNAAAHHSAEKVAAGEKNSGLRAQTSFSAARPGVLKDPAPQGAVTVGYVAAPGPLLCTPLLADTAADTVDARTVKYLLHASLKGERGEAEGEGGEEARGDCVACRADGAQDPGTATQDHGALG